MSRLELARFLRTSANGLQLPLVDGTNLTKEEAQSINVAMDKLRLAAESIEIGNAAAVKDGMVEANAA